VLQRRGDQPTEVERCAKLGSLDGEPAPRIRGDGRRGIGTAIGRR
jgi:hypothetical protein